MEDIVAQIATVQSGVMVLAIIAITAIIRRIVETLVPSLTMKAAENDAGKSYENRGAELWNKLGLYLVPVVIGIALAFGHTDLQVGEGVASSGDRILYGLLLGYFSRDIFKAFRQAFKRKFDVEIAAQ